MIIQGAKFELREVPIPSVAITRENIFDTFLQHSIATNDIAQMSHAYWIDYLAPNKELIDSILIEKLADEAVHNQDIYSIYKKDPAEHDGEGYLVFNPRDEDRYALGSTGVSFLAASEANKALLAALTLKPGLMDLAINIAAHYASSTDMNEKHKGLGLLAELVRSPHQVAAQELADFFSSIATRSESDYPQIDSKDRRQTTLLSNIRYTARLALWALFAKSQDILTPKIVGQIEAAIDDPDVWQRKGVACDLYDPMARARPEIFTQPIRAPQPLRLL